MPKLWEKDYQPDQLAAKYAVGSDYLMDNRLLRYDCVASMAHARALHKIGVFDEVELDQVLQALDEIVALYEAGNFVVRAEDEDMHTAIEGFLTSKLGETGQKIHTGRSRNDQVLTALRLYYKDELNKIKELSQEYVQALEDFRAKFGQVELPGFTHTRKAMPSSIDLWAGCWLESMQDNLFLIDAALRLVDQSPLGSAAGYGSPWPLDREFTATELGFAKVQANSIYCQLSRGKFESTIIHVLSQIMFDLNRLSTDLILFSEDTFGFFGIPKEFTTGSSIMPQKYNADILEVMRSNYHIVVSGELVIKNCLAGLITGYNSDVRPVKEVMIKTFGLVTDSLELATLLFSKLEVNQENCRRHLTPEVYATREAFDLVRQGLPFRQAYKEVAKKYMR